MRAEGGLLTGHGGGVGSGRAVFKPSLIGSTVQHTVVFLFFFSSPIFSVMFLLVLFYFP